jgi:hypothetical protein
MHDVKIEYLTFEWNKCAIGKINNHLTKVNQLVLD